ncbi:MAG: DUF2835 family protein [Pseudomonadales bacterium]|nr:DUF2835 family protein [Pseudomonadales bacterium]
MREYIIDIEIDRVRLLAFYRGSVNAVQGVARSGERLSLPLSCLRPWVGAGGLKGTFRLQVDDRRRLRDIRRIA